MNFAESESRPVLGPAGNKTTPIRTRNQVSKPQRKVVKTKLSDDTKGKKAPAAAIANAASPQCFSKPSILKHQEQKFLRSNLSLNASCSSDASSDSSFSRSSTGRIRRNAMVTPTRRKESSPKTEKVEKAVADADTVSVGSADTPPVKKRCAWVTPNTDPYYSAFHDEEWGVPVHDDKRLFELLSLSSSLAELTWPAILNKRHTFREVFLEFDPVAVSKLNEKRMLMQGSTASVLLSELKLRGILENARQICKIIDEFGSFDKYIWGFVNHKPIVGQFRYPRLVPIKTSKADAISKDLVRRGFRGVGPTTIYSFMQTVGMTNDHLISCFRFQQCIAAAETRDRDDSIKGKVEEKQTLDLIDLGLGRAMDDLRLPAV